MGGLAKFFFGGFVGAIFGFLVSPKRAQKVRDALFAPEHGPAANEDRRLGAASRAPDLALPAASVSRPLGEVPRPRRIEQEPEIPAHPPVPPAPPESPAARPYPPSERDLPLGPDSVAGRQVGERGWPMEQAPMAQVQEEYAASPEQLAGPVEPSPSEEQEPAADEGLFAFRPEPVGVAPEIPAFGLETEPAEAVRSDQEAEPEPESVEAYPPASVAGTAAPEPEGPGFDAELEPEPEVVEAEPEGYEPEPVALEPEPAAAYEPEPVTGEPEPELLWEPSVTPLEPGVEAEPFMEPAEPEEAPAVAVSREAEQEPPAAEAEPAPYVEAEPGPYVEAEAPYVEPEPLAPTAGLVGVQPMAPADLKARIEETRRRIQRELEQPFTRPRQPETAAPAAPEERPVAIEEQYVPAAEEAWTPVPLEEEQLAESLAPQPPEPGAESEPEPEPELGPTLVSEEKPVPAVAPSVAGFDHDAMRQRIEETRNRLKAKAFDAMMSGEGALLRENQGTAEGSSATASAVRVDTEVEETIESALTEEDF